jgi:tRNA threonylcarbamoyladenosine biosynthesis protein TsaE
VQENYIAQGEKDLLSIAKNVLRHCNKSKVFALEGELGAGKTTFIGALCRELGVTDHVLSPTFALIHEYSNHEVVYHIDCFRLKSAAEAIDAGLNEYLDGKNFCFIEWPQIIKTLLPEKINRIELKVKEDGSRLISISC